MSAYKIFVKKNREVGKSKVRYEIKKLERGIEELILVTFVSSVVAFLLGCFMGCIQIALEFGRGLSHPADGWTILIYGLIGLTATLILSPIVSFLDEGNPFAKKWKETYIYFDSLENAKGFIKNKVRLIEDGL